MRILKAVVAIVLGLIVYASAFQRQVALAMVNKVVGGDQPCPWAQLAQYPWKVPRFVELQKEAEKSVVVEAEDAALGIQKIRTSGRTFWIKKEGKEMPGKSTLAYVLAEQSWIGESAPQFTVKKGDVVVDVGAHIGTFDDDALRRGAAKCILVEPDPVNVECIRRNFAKEIAEGRIIVVPEGAWSSHSTLEFNTGIANSGSGSFLHKEVGATSFKVPVRPLDEILAGLGIAHVDYIKLDIEGAEREALKGAANTLKNSKPVLMLDSYHEPDDAIVLPKVILAGNPAYKPNCVLCSPDPQGSRFIPYSVFYK